jgi:hypothetical protein
VKRTILISLTLIYLLSCSGIAVNRFYCCGKLAAVKLLYAAPEYTGTKTICKNDCCKNERQSFKIKDTHVSSTNVSLAEPMPVVLPKRLKLDAIAFAQVIPIQLPYQGNAPPEHSDTAIYTLNCTYRI